MTGLPEVVWTPMGSDNQLPRGFEDACLMAFRASVTDRLALDACESRGYSQPHHRGSYEVRITRVRIRRRPLRKQQRELVRPPGNHGTSR
jgi:hypothetical protein